MNRITIDPVPIADRAASQEVPRSFQRRPVNLRSVTLGLLGVVLICALSPYNDYAVNNVWVVETFLPVGPLLLATMLVMLVNAPLRRWLPRQALASGELAVILGMMLVSAAVPNVGLMRYLPSNLVSYFLDAAENSEMAHVLRQADLPDWLYPAFESSDPVQRGADPIAQNFRQRTPLDGDGWRDRLGAVPWSAWVRPAIAWGLFIGLLYGATICMIVIFRRQWVENERLPFPIATIYSALIESPQPGHALNGLFRSRLFWIACGTVFALRLLYGLNVYYPRYWPAVALEFDLRGLLSEAPWSYAEDHFKQQRINFIIIGIAFFLQTKVSFSLWFFFVLLQVVRMYFGAFGTDFPGDGEIDQTIGGFSAWGVAFLIIARKHLLAVVRQMIRPGGQHEVRGKYLPYSIAGWAFAACVGGMIAWLLAAGMTFAGAIILVGTILFLFLILARIVAETGLVTVIFWFPTTRWWIYALQDFPSALAVRTTTRTFFLTNMISGMLTHDMSQSLPPHAMHALRVADNTAYEEPTRWRAAAPFVLCLMLALAVAFVVSGASMLYVEYNHAVTLDSRQITPLNDWGAMGMTKWFLGPQAIAYTPPRTGPNESHSRLAHLGFGASFTAFLSYMRLRYSAWPFHPLGYLMAFTWALKGIWFSLFLGWLVKAVAVKYGGAGFIRDAKPLFIGLILGHAASVGFWLIVSLVRLGMGLPYHSIGGWGT